MSTLFITHPVYLEHLTPLGHPERPDRLRAIDRALEAEKFQALARVQAPLAALEAIALCHPIDYITALREAAPREGLIHLDADTSMSPRSFEAALRGAGGAIHAIDEVLTKKAANAFVAARPPGHHAETARPMGFCLFDNAAIATRYAQHRYGITSAAIIDFDVHHSDVLFDASNAAVSRHRGGRRIRGVQYGGKRAAASRRRRHGVPRRIRESDLAPACRVQA